MAKWNYVGVNTARLRVMTEDEKMERLRLMHSGDEKSGPPGPAGAGGREPAAGAQRDPAVFRAQRKPRRFIPSGMHRLMKAIDHFDISQGVRFSTYGVPMIIGEIRRYLRDNNSVRVSRSLRDMAYKAMQMKEKLTREKNREPTVEEIAKGLEQPVESVVTALEAIVEPVSLYEPLYNDGGEPVYVLDQLGDGAGEDDWLEEIALKQAVQALSDREKKILTMRFMEGRTQMEVASVIASARPRSPGWRKRRSPGLKRPCSGIRLPKTAYLS